MPNDLQVDVVPRDLYYHEVEYVRGLEDSLRKHKEFLAAYRRTYTETQSHPTPTQEAEVMALARDLS